VRPKAAGKRDTAGGGVAGSGPFGSVLATDASRRQFNPVTASNQQISAPSTKINRVGQYYKSGVQFAKYDFGSV